MDWGRLFAGTFWLIFLAELGDKTQLAAMARAGGGPAGWTARWVVFLGASTALVASTAIAVFLGGWLFEKLIPDPRYVRIASGILFLVFGFSMLYSVFFTCQGEMAHPEASASQPQAEQSARGYLARLALQAALDFESASSDRYRRLSAREPDSPFADLLNSLADEEDRHRASLAELVSGGYGQTPPFGDECPMPRKVEGEIADGEAGDMAWRREAVANLIEHERASAEFYRALADRTIVPSVKPVFQRLAEDEWRHLDRLECGFRSNGKS